MKTFLVKPYFFIVNFCVTLSLRDAGSNEISIKIEKKIFFFPEGIRYYLGDISPLKSNFFTPSLRTCSLVVGQGSEVSGILDIILFALEK